VLVITPSQAKMTNVVDKGKMLDAIVVAGVSIAEYLRLTSERAKPKTGDFGPSTSSSAKAMIRAARVVVVVTLPLFDYVVNGEKNLSRLKKLDWWEFWTWKKVNQPAVGGAPHMGGFPPTGFDWGTYGPLLDLLPGLNSAATKGDGAEAPWLCYSMIVICLYLHARFYVSWNRGGVE
jgi:hypothetical protein